MIDLHTHSYFSDGSDSPEEIVDQAAQVGLSAVSLTDHDTLAGIARAQREARRLGIELIPGLELSLDVEGMHLLAYQIDKTSGLLNKQLSHIQASRVERNKEIIRQLNQQGIGIELAEVLREAGPGLVGRPHIASVLVHHGYVSTIQEAFDHYIGPDGSASVSRFGLSPQSAIELVRETGGIPVLAHPHTVVSRHPGMVLGELLVTLVSYGLMGLECLHSAYNPDQQRDLVQLAEQHGLLVTGGSDYHGTYRPGTYIGVGRGDLRVPDRLLEPLRQRVA